MSRPIKFRAFSKVTGEWIENFLISSDGQFESWNGDMENDHRVYRPINRDSILLMQFTGLLDKNGTEIYEGDVVKINASAGSKRHFEIRFLDGAFCIGCSGAGNLTTDDFTPLRNAIFEAKKHSTAGELIIEVIGNIHENPELLNA